MKFVISSAELLEHLQLMSRVMSSKNTLPILDNILLSLKGNTLTIMATDLETTLVSEVNVPNVEEEGSVAIPKLMVDSLRELSDQPITTIVDPETHFINLTWATGHYDIPGYSAEEFPSIPQIGTGASQLAMGALALNDGINRTIFATANDELRPTMNGVLFDLHEEDIVFVATDAHKLVRYTRTDIKPGKETSFILPKKSVVLLKTILAKETEEVSLSFDEKNASFTMPNYRLVCRLIEGNFPAYNSVIPEENPNKVSINRVEMLTVVKRIATMAPAGSNLIRLHFTNNQLTVSAQDLDFSYSGAERLNCHYEGDDLEIGFKSPFLIEILQNIVSQEVNIELSTPSRAGLILPASENSSDESTLMLLMPMMING